MTRAELKQRLARRDPLVCHMAFEFFTSGISILVANAGYDFVIFDMEHTALDQSAIARVLRESSGAGIPRMVRVPDSDYYLISRVLDQGADGIMAPRVESREQAEAIVAAIKYPPVGRRGSAFGYAHDNYVVGDVAAKIAKINAETTVIVQIETAAGLEHLDAILSVPGVDVAWVGHYDLSLSLGIPGQFDSPTFIAAAERISAAAKAHGLSAGWSCQTREDSIHRFEQGYNCINAGTDVGLFRQAASAIVSGVRAGITSRGK